MVAFLAGLFSQWIHITQRSVTVKSLSDPDRFQSKFIDLIKAVKADRLVIAIDNLDRCSPEKAVEMLSTIKTYLEPAVEPPSSQRPQIFRCGPAVKDVVFVVSVDDEALRRHLLAQELNRSATRGATRRCGTWRSIWPSSSTCASRSGGSWPVTRAYVAHHLGSLIDDRGYEEERTRLISLVSTALRRNPRRIKQFVNDLEARLRLLEERQKPGPDAKPGIAAPVSEDVLMVAKLALIESEWPGAFSRLQNEPRRLAEWHSEAEAEDEVWAYEGGGGSTDRTSVRPLATFAAFLRASRPIGSVRSSRALLDLKQAPNEAGLAGFAEFRESVISGERAEVQRLVDAAPEADRARYAERLKAVLQEEVGQGDLDAARAVVDIALSVEAVSVHKDAQREVLEEALDSPQLREQLRQLDPEPTLEAGQRLADDKREQLHDVVLVRLSDDDPSEDSQRRVTQAFASVARNVSSATQARLRDQLARPEITEKFGLYVDLAEVLPGALPVGTAARALDVVRSAHDPESPALAWDSEAEHTAARGLPRPSRRS